jgi:hypothetical protein
MEEGKEKIIRIALIGPESTGKSSLAEKLAKHYQTVFVLEHARNYISQLKHRYKLKDVLAIAREQLIDEKQTMEAAHKFLFADTELIIAKVWCEDVFNVSPDWIADNIIKYKYDFYLLTYPDLPWMPDMVRVNPERREYLFEKYEQELKLIKANYAIIRGSGNTRLANCINAIDTQFA